ncbi:MAG: FAD-dependent oxidoreductase [Pseudomonadota bacterium]
MPTVDLAIAGAGVFGLQLARQALLQGLSVAIFDARRVGEGASGGPLGALMPHIPDRWNAKKQFQFDALRELEGECLALEEATGLGTGYGRVGRMMPLREERFIALAEERAHGAQAHWEGKFAFNRMEPDPNWIDPRLATHGAVLDTLAARLHPSSYLSALAKFVADHPNGRLYERTEVPLAATEGRRIETADGPLSFAHLVLAAGYQSFPWLKGIIEVEPGTGVKGQARVVKAAAPAEAPILYDDGCYVVPHANGTIAVGSSSQKQWTDERAPDPEAWTFWDKALALCPALREAPIIGEWAGVRPRAMSADPMIGPVPDQDGLWVFTGGFKISLGIAHLAGRALVHQITSLDEQTALPESFRAEVHLAAARSAS